MHDISGDPHDVSHPSARTAARRPNPKGAPSTDPAVADEVPLTHQLLEALGVLASDAPLEETLHHLLRTATQLTGAEDGELDVRGHPLVAGRHDSPVRERPGPSPHEAARMPLTSVVAVGGLVVGHLRLADRADGQPFDEQDVRIASVIAGVAGVALENAELREQAAHRDQWSSAPSELLTGDPDDEVVYQHLVDWALATSGAEVAWVVAGPGPTHLTLRAVSGLEATPEALAGVRFHTSLARCVAFTGHPMTITSIADHHWAIDVADALGQGPTGPGMLVPVTCPRGVEAVVVVAWRGQDDSVVRRAGRRDVLAHLTARAPEVLRDVRADLDKQRRAVLHDRGRIARDLHDLVIQRLFALTLDLQSTSPLDDPEEVAHRLARASKEIDATIRDIRGTIFRLDSNGDDSDPRAAIVHLVERATRTMKMRPSLQFDGPVRTLIDPELLPDVLAVLSEALSNAVRHAQATRCSVEVSVGNEVVVRVSDDGTGFPETATESGLANVRRRAERRDGHLGISSTPNSGTLLVWAVPLT